MVIELSDMEFDYRVSEGISFVKVWSPICQPCKQYKGIFEAFASKHEEVNCYSVDAFECPDTISKFGVRRAPTTIVLQDGELVDKKPGVLAMNELEAMIPSDF